MPFDAVFLSAVLEELSPSLLGNRVEKFQQPAADTVILSLRAALIPTRNACSSIR